MRIFTQQKKFASRRQSGLSLLEMMVATTLLVVMMLGLTAMFNQTQRAFRSGLKQVDVFEGGRAVMEMIVRDVEQMAASKVTDNLYALPVPSSTFVQAFNNGAGQQMDRTNVLFSTYFLNHSGDWSPVSYRVLDSQNPDTNRIFIGSLYRYSTNFSDLPKNFLTTFISKKPSELVNGGSMIRLTDGVIHFRIQFYDTSGNLFTNNVTVTNNGVVTTDIFARYLLSGERETLFKNESLPAMAEVELGIVEPQTLQQVRSMPPANQRAYLERQVGKVHIFRQQIPIRNVQR